MFDWLWQIIAAVAALAAGYFGIRSSWLQHKIDRDKAERAAGAGGLYLIIPEIVAISQAASSAQLEFSLAKVTALASAVGLAGQTASGLIGVMFSDKPDESQAR